MQIDHPITQSLKYQTQTVQNTRLAHLAVT